MTETNGGRTASAARIAQARAQRAGWRMLGPAAQALDLACADVIEVAGGEAAAHVALLARQFPGLAFEFADAEAAEDFAADETMRVLWAPDGLDGVDVSRHDALVVAHPPAEVRAVIDACRGFARVAAVRDMGCGLALSVFGRGLARDLFRPRVRSPQAA